LEAAERLHYGTTRGIGNSNSAIKGMEGSLGKKGDWQKWLGKNNTKPWNTHIKQVVGVNDCVVCKKRLPLSNFQQLYKDKYTSDVYRNECLDCHREKRKEWTRNYKQAHPDKIAAYGAKRRAKIAGSLVELSKEEQERVNLIYKERVRLNKEAGYIKYHVDHIKPLARGGKHSPDNLQILLKPDNLKKSWKWEEDDAR
jgi:5-methylcytosine-specific restriction endonuclease McrA